MGDHTFQALHHVRACAYIRMHTQMTKADTTTASVCTCTEYQNERVMEECDSPFPPLKPIYEITQRISIKFGICGLDYNLAWNLLSWQDSKKYIRSELYAV